MYVLSLAGEDHVGEEAWLGGLSGAVLAAIALECGVGPWLVGQA